MTRHPDLIVLGLGGVGSATARAAAARGARVLGLERFDLVHDRGSSHGQTRIIRKAYFEHPDYVPLLTRAYAAWAGLEAEVGRTLFERTGLLLVGPPKGSVIAGTRRAAEIHQLPVDVFDAADLPARFPGFKTMEGATALFEADAGFLRVEDCVAAALASARRQGAELRPRAGVTRWEADQDGVTVWTEDGPVRGGALVLAAGAWAGSLLPSLARALQPQRQVQLWLTCKDDALRLDRGAPTFGFQEVDGSFFYGFPSLDPGAIKLAEHGGGEAVADPSELRRALLPEDVTRVAAFARRRLRGVDTPVLRHAACLYTMSPDEHFVVDRHPQHGRVAFAAGLSGHGFKFASALGEILADLALEGRTSAPIGFLSAERLVNLV